MRKLILFFISLFAVCSIFSKDLFTEKTEDNQVYGYIEINNPDAKFLRVTNTEIDTISVNDVFPKKTELSLICFISKTWCKPWYVGFNTLYNDSIIEFLKNNDTRLIVLAYDYPFIKVNQLDSVARNNIESDFEIYYRANRNDRQIVYFPQIWLIDAHKRIIFHSHGIREDYNELKENLKDYKKSHMCLRCNGAGMVKSNRRGGID